MLVLYLAILSLPSPSLLTARFVCACVRVCLCVTVYGLFVCSVHFLPSLSVMYVRIAPWFDVAPGLIVVDWRAAGLAESPVADSDRRGAGLVFRGGVLCDALDGER